MNQDRSTTAFQVIEDLVEAFPNLAAGVRTSLSVPLAGTLVGYEVTTWETAEGSARNKHYRVNALVDCDGAVNRVAVLRLREGHLERPRAKGRKVLSIDDVAKSFPQLASTVRLLTAACVPSNATLLGYTARAWRDGSGEIGSHVRVFICAVVRQPGRLDETLIPLVNETAGEIDTLAKLTVLVAQGPPTWLATSVAIEGARSAAIALRWLGRAEALASNANADELPAEVKEILESARMAMEHLARSARLVRDSELFHLEEPIRAGRGVPKRAKSAGDARGRQRTEEAEAWWPDGLNWVQTHLNELPLRKKPESRDRVATWMGKEWDKRPFDGGPHDLHSHAYLTDTVLPKWESRGLHRPTIDDPGNSKRRPATRRSNITR